MTYLLGLQLSGAADDVVIFEVDPGEVSGDLVLASDAPGQLADRAVTTLDQALAGLEPALSRIRESLKRVSPDETTVEFGLKIGGEAGVIIAKGTSEVNFTVQMSWKSA